MLAAALAALAPLLVADRVWAVGDHAPLDFQEVDLEAMLRHRVARAPRGRILWVRADPAIQHGPYVRSSDSIWVGRTARGDGNNRHAELAELDGEGRELRVHALLYRWSTAPSFGALGSVFGWVNGRYPVAWSHAGEILWKGSHFREARHLAADALGGVFVASHYGVLARLDRRGQQRFSTNLGGALVGSPLVLPNGTSVSCVATGGALVAVDGLGKLLFRDDKARCTAPSILTPDGTLVTPTEGGLRLSDLQGQRVRLLPVSGRLGPALRSPDGSLSVASSLGLVTSLSPTGRAQWTFPIGKTDHPPPLQPYPGGGLAVTSQVGYVLALDASGRLRWSMPVPAPSPLAWVRPDGAILTLSPGDGLRLVAPPLAAKR